MSLATSQGHRSTELAPEGVVFHKPARSNSQGACVEVAEGATTLIRDTQHRALGYLGFASSEWAALRAVV